MKKRFCLTFVFCLGFVFMSMAQSLKLRTAFESIKRNYYQEKLYLHTDKSYYVAGETVWFKAYLRDARTHGSALSNFVYVELVDKSDKVHHRIKVRKDSVNGFFGHLPLSEELPSGDYQLRAYSWWMQNVGEEFFFKRTVSIENVIRRRIQVTPEFKVLPQDKVRVTLTVADMNGSPLQGKEFDLNVRDQSEKYLRTNKDGIVEFTIDIKNKSTRMFFDLESYKKPEEYDQRFYVPFLLPDYDVSFFPESGNLLSGVPQFVAFKALASDGLSHSVTGTVYTIDGDIVTEIQSLHKGMGKFMLTPLEGMQYYAIMEDFNGVKKRFFLPKVQPSGIGVQIFHRGNTLRFNVLNQSPISSDSLILIAHQRGELRMTQELTSEALAGTIDTKSVPPGILTFSVMDKSGSQVFCERLLFVNQEDLVVEMQTHKPVYTKRDSVSLEFQLQEITGEPVFGDFSLSITDGEVVRQDSLADNIVNNFLLTSDLKGYIEDPEFYFLSDDNSRREALDMLLLTQGWTRFDLEETLNVPVPEYAYEMEIGQVVSGMVKNIQGRPYSNAQIVLFSRLDQMVNLGVSDEKGRFTIDGLSFADSTTYSIQSLNKNGKNLSTQIVPDPDVFPDPHTYIPDRSQDLESEIKEYRQTMRNRYQEEGGLKLVYLEEVQILGTRNKNDPYQDIMKNMSRLSVTAEELGDKYAGMSFWDILSVLPYIQEVDMANFSAKIRNQSAGFILDQFAVDGETMNTISSEDIESIHVLTDPTATIIFSSSGNPLVRVVLKRGELSTARTSPGQAVIRPLGYQKPKDFYRPTYTLEEQKKSRVPDLRTTLHWEPTLFPDETGRIRVNFYSADKDNDYQVILEGISDQGKFLRYSGTIKRK